jgi:hypothetical protein
MVPETQKSHVYYRCAKPACPTKTVREEAVATAIDACLLRTQLGVLDLTDFEGRMEAWINSREDAERERAWQLRKANLQDRIDRLTDALIDRLIDKEAFGERRQRLAMEEESLEEERREWADKGKKAASMRKLIELANNLVQSHQMAVQAEKRQLVEMTTSNRRVYGKDVYIEPSDWLHEVEDTLGVPVGEPSRDGTK